MFRLLARLNVNLRFARVLLVALVALQLAGCSSSAQRAQNYYEDGAKLLSQHEYQKAGLQFRNAIALKKDLLPAWRGLAQVEEQQQHWAALVPILRTIVELDPKDVETKIKLARLMLDGGATDQATKVVSSIDGGDSNPKVLVLKAAISYRHKDYTNAVQQAQAALKIDPANVDAMMILAANQLDNGDPKAALQILDRDPLAQKTDLGILLFKIKVLQKLGDVAQIESLLQKLIELHPKEPNYRLQLARFYIEQHRSDDAEKQLRAIVAADPKNSSVEFDLIRLLYVLKGPAAARTELVARIDAGGDVFPYQIALAEFDFRQGNTVDSFKLLEKLASDPSSPEHALTAKIRLAELNLEKKNLDAAEALVSEILNSDSRNNDALRLRAIIHMDRGQLDPAISDLREALNDQPRSVPLMLLLASAYETGGSIELAEKEFADATRVSNYNPSVALNYVAFLRRRGSAQRAEDVLNDLVNRQPNNVAVLSVLAEVKLTLQDFAGAQAIAETIKRIGGNGAIVDQILGAALGGEHKFDQSIAALQAAVAAEPSAVQPMIALVQEMVRAKQTDKAVAFLQAALNTNPANVQALVLLGSIEASVNQAPDKAIVDFKTAIEKQPNNPIGYTALADLYLTQKNTNAALQVVQSGLKLLPDNVVLHMSLAGIMEQGQNYDGAISQYEYVLAQQPGLLVAANNLASLLADHRTDKASLDRAEVLAASLRKTEVPQFKDTIGWVQYREGDYKTAGALLQEAATALPDVALIHYHLGMSYEATGQNALAAEQFKTALTKSPSDDLAEKLKTELKKTATQ